MDLALDGIESYRVVRCVWCEDRDCGTGGEGVNGGLVCFRVAFVVGRIRVEGCVETVVDLGDVFVEMFAWISFH